MAFDPRSLQIQQLVALVNSTKLGPVLNDRRFVRHRRMAGLRICDAGNLRRIDFLKYAGWLMWRRHLPADYEGDKDRARLANMARSFASRDVGEFPARKNPERHARCREILRLFCEEYFPRTFSRPWSRDQLKVLTLVERVVRTGGLYAIALPRGGGKTSICEVACIWAIFYGLCRFVTIIGPDENHAADRIKNIKSEIEHNDSLLDDFPSICYPVRRLDGINQRTLIYHGKNIKIGFSSQRISLPDIEDGDAPGAVMSAVGLTGQVRGLMLKCVDGSSIRPDLLMIDDPQTRESAHSPSQCAYREKIINGDVLGLAGPGTKLGAIMPCTVIRVDDLADRLLDRAKSPQWQGERTKMVNAWPSSETLWRRYVEIRRECQRQQLSPEPATDFYTQNRAEMDEGAQVSWEARYNPDELSAIQHAYNIRADRGEEAFFAEYQNEPLPDAEIDAELLTADQIASKINSHDRWEVPAGCTHVTAFIDVHAKALYWVVLAWEDDFTGYVIDYGTDPDQHAAYFTLSDIKRTLEVSAPKSGLEGAIYAGLERTVDALIAREFMRLKTAVHIDKIMIDANWGRMTALVYKFCRQSKHAGVVFPSHGKYVGASSVPMLEYNKKPGDRTGLNWRMSQSHERGVRRVVYDTNFWKSFIQSRLVVSMGDPGCLSFFGSSTEHHRMIADHMTAEYRVKTEGRGRKVDEWKIRQERPDNHFLDCVVGAAVLASVDGVGMPGVLQQTRKRRRVPLAELMNRKSA